MFRHNYSESLTVLKDIIDGKYGHYELMADYGDNFREGAAYENNAESLFEVQFLDYGMGGSDEEWTPVNISSNELIEAFVEPMNDILEAIHAVLERTPPQLVGDLDQNGIIISGGGSLVYGMDRLIERSTGIRTIPVDDPVSCATYGAGKMLKHLEEMQDGMMNFHRMRQLK